MTRQTTLIRASLSAREGIEALATELDMPSLGATVDLLVAAGLSPEGMAVLRQVRSLPRVTTWDAYRRSPRSM